MKNKYVYHSKISEEKFRLVLKLWCENLTIETTCRLSNLSKGTVYLLYLKIQKPVIELALEESNWHGDQLEIDESYFGPKRVRGKRGRGAGRKIPVVGLLERGGKVYVQIIPDCTRKTLEPIVKGRILDETDVYTDSWRAYKGILVNNKHYRVHHSKNEFARGKSHVNGIESFWSYAKSIIRKRNGIKDERFGFHLKEIEYRFNHRNHDLYGLLLKQIRTNPL